MFSLKPGLKSSSDGWYWAVFHNLSLPPFQYNVGVVPGVVASRSSQ